MIGLQASETPFDNSCNMLSDFDTPGLVRGEEGTEGGRETKGGLELRAVQP